MGEIAFGARNTLLSHCHKAGSTCDKSVPLTTQNGDSVALLGAVGRSKALGTTAGVMTVLVEERLKPAF
jgi:hypothetical protein